MLNSCAVQPLLSRNSVELLSARGDFGLVEAPGGHPERRADRHRNSHRECRRTTSRITAPTLRSWERRYRLSPSARSTRGHRGYSADHLPRLRAIVQLVNSGVPTAEAPSTARDRIHPARSPNVTSATSVAEGTAHKLTPNASWPVDTLVAAHRSTHPPRVAAAETSGEVHDVVVAGRSGYWVRPLQRRGLSLRCGAPGSWGAEGLCGLRRRAA